MKILNGVAVLLLTVFLCSCSSIIMKEDRFTGEKISRTNMNNVRVNPLTGERLTLDIIKIEKDSHEPSFYLEARHFLPRMGLLAPSLKTQMNIKAGKSLIFLADGKIFEFATAADGSRSASGDSSTGLGGQVEVARYVVPDPKVLSQIFNSKSIEVKLIGYIRDYEGTMDPIRLIPFINKYCNDDPRAKKVDMARKGQTKILPSKLKQEI
ncbi:MAG: hypothetical protein A3F16_05355 [Deltaproteobacteria bacterium RIFCSPHIGHO2_12_FULL_43_9]|nr:MAG: hypothetical protein A3F16_05355 [Deltaproteobacteria bacterium RIFCSPHIGHO2_12_FULL_43_9]